MRCVSCGGILGRDCFNPQECAWITRDMEMREQMVHAYVTTNDLPLDIDHTPADYTEAVEMLKRARTYVEDAKRYRWFRSLSNERRVCIAEMSGDDLLDHFIDKGMCGL